MFLDKNPGLRPVGVGKVISRIIDKVVVHTLKENIIKSVGNLQVCAGHELGCLRTCNETHFKLFLIKKFLIESNVAHSQCNILTFYVIDSPVIVFNAKF